MTRTEQKRKANQGRMNIFNEFNAMLLSTAFTTRNVKVEYTKRFWDEATIKGKVSDRQIIGLSIILSDQLLRKMCFEGKKADYRRYQIFYVMSFGQVFAIQIMSNKSFRVLSTKKWNESYENILLFVDNQSAMNNTCYAGMGEFYDKKQKEFSEDDWYEAKYQLKYTILRTAHHPEGEWVEKL